MPYGTLKVDNIIFTNAGVDQTITVSGIVASTSGNLTVTGTVSGSVIRGTTVSGTTVTGSTGQFGNLTAVSGTFTTQISGATVTGTTANFTSGNFTVISGGTHTITSGVFAAGTAANPSISFTSDPNTGIYSPGADQVAISTNGSGRLFINSSGNVGVGTSSPSTKLDVAGDLTFSAGGAGWRTAAINGIDEGGSFQGSLAFYTHPSAGAGGAPTEKMRLTSAGRLGLGTSSPGQLLDVRGASGSAIQLANTSDGSRGAQLVVTGSASTGTVAFNTTSAGYGITFGIDSVAKVAIDTSGRLGVGTTSPKIDFQTGTSGGIQATSANEIAIRYNLYNSGGDKYIQAVNKAASLVLNSDGDFLFYNTNTASTAADSAVTGLGARMAIKASGNVGIGTTSPSQLLHVSGGYALLDGLRIKGTDTANSIFQSAAFGLSTNNYITFAAGTGEPERMRLDSSGRLLVGTSSTSQGNAIFQARATTDGRAAELFFSGDNASGAYLTLTKSRGTASSPTEVSSGDDLGGFIFVGYDGAAYREAAYIQCQADGTWTDGGDTTDNPGRLVFSTTADGASSPTERMRITNSGRFAFGGQGVPYSSATCDTYNNASGEFAHVFRQDHASGYGIGIGIDGTYLAYFYPNKDLSGAPVGSISQNGSATAYNTTSDYRLKENVTPLTGAIDRVNQLLVHRFNFIANPNKTVDGFLAHEAQSVVPECVTGTKDEVDADGNPVYQGIDQSKLVPLLTAALQEAIAKIETLEAKVAALEAA